jgi:predicted LPLAT superfamily acyltransferase
MKVLMYEENAPIITDVLTKLNPDIANMVIPARLPHTMLQVKDCLDKGGLVGILGDRTIPSDKVVSCKFFGDFTPFPAGPLLLASILNVPVFLFFGLYRGGRRYDIYFELLAERIVIDRQERMRDIQMWTQRYAERLEWYCRLAPYNWFNFYDYWNERS